MVKWIVCTALQLPETDENALLRALVLQRIANEEAEAKDKAAKLIQQHWRKHILRVALYRTAKQYRKEVRSCLAVYRATPCFILWMLPELVADSTAAACNVASREGESHVPGHPQVQSATSTWCVMCGVVLACFW